MLAVGSTFAWIGDGLSGLNGGVGRGAANPGSQFQTRMAGRLQPVALPVMGMSGTTIGRVIGANSPWINPYAIDAAAAQTPNVFVLGTMGANDNVLSNNPGANPASGQTSYGPLQDWYDAVNYAYAKFAAYASPTDLLVIVGTAPSTKANETTVDAGQTQNRRARVWAAQQAHVQALTATDPRVLFVPVTAMLPMSSYSSDSGGLFVHPDSRGADFIANAVISTITAKVQSKTAAEIADMIDAGTYPLMAGAQLDTDTALAGTAGTITGPGVTGTIATSKLIANTTGATGITVSQVATAGGRTKTVVNFAGSTATTASGRVLVQDKTNATLTVATTPGQYVMTGALFRASQGYGNYGADWSGGLYGMWAASGSSVGPPSSPGASAIAAGAIDTLAMSSPVSTYGNSTSASGRRSFGIWFPAGATPTGTFETEREFAYIVSERTRHAPKYLGDLAPASGQRLNDTTQALRPSGSVSAATGGTVRVEPGLWTPRGLTNSDYVSRRIYAGGSAALGTGTLLATLSGTAWTHTVAAGALTAGTLIYVEVDVSNGIGTTMTARSITTLTVTA